MKMTTKQRIEKRYEARQAILAAANTVERDLRDLKPGDEVWLDTGFYPVFDAYLISQNVFMLKYVLPNGNIRSERTRFTVGSDTTGHTTFVCRV
jgi:hypothetical protein